MATLHLSTTFRRAGGLGAASLLALTVLTSTSAQGSTPAARAVSPPAPTYVTDISGLRQVDEIDVDAGGNVYASGRAAAGFQATPGAYDSGRPDGLAVVSLDAAGGSRWRARIGGASGAYGEGASEQAVDSHGNVYLTGVTENADFPTTVGALGRTYWNTAAGRTTFLLKFGPGGKLVYSARIPGSEQPGGIAVDSSGAVYLSGTTSPDFSPSPDAFDHVPAGDSDAYVAKIAANGSAMVWSSLLGGSKGDMGIGVALAPGGAVVVGGQTWSTDFPTTTGAPEQEADASLVSAFATKVAADGRSAVWSTYVPRADNEWPAGVKVAPDGRVNALGFIDGVTPTPAGQPERGGTFSQISADGTTITKIPTLQFNGSQGLSTTPSGTLLGFGKVTGSGRFNDLVIELTFNGALVRSVALGGIGLAVGGDGVTTYVAFDHDPYLRVAAPTRPRVLARYSRCTIRGTARNDVLRGTPRADVICGLGGNDTVIGRGGADLILGGNGRDRVHGGAGVDVLVGGAGKDWMYGGYGRDRCRGTRGVDVFSSCERR